MTGRPSTRNSGLDLPRRINRITLLCYPIRNNADHAVEQDVLPSSRHGRDYRRIGCITMDLLLHL